MDKDSFPLIPLPIKEAIHPDCGGNAADFNTLFPLIPLPIKEAIGNLLGLYSSLAMFPLIPLPIKEAITIGWMTYIPKRKMFPLIPLPIKEAISKKAYSRLLL